jgi:cobalt/nickel transport system permease protein
MQADFLDRYSRGSSLVHRCDARLKLLATLGLVAAVIATPLAWWPLYGLEAALVLGIYALARLPWRYLVVRLLALLPFLVLLAGSVPLARGLASGWDVAGQLLARALIALAAMITLTATTPFSSLLAALARLRVPAVLISILAFMYRYMFVLIEEWQRMRRAKLSRTFYPGIRWEARLMANFAGILFVRAFERAERVYAAMCARGWTGTMPPQDGTR